MHTARIVFTVIIALVLMGCPPPVSDNSASGGNAPAQGGANPDNSAFSGSNNPDNPAQNGDNPAPVRKHHVAYVSSGNEHSMILKTDDTLWAVGGNAEGQLGNNSTDNALHPVKVMTEVKQVSANGTHTIILEKNGTLWAVGNNEFGQLGDGTTNDGWTPVKVKEKNPGGGVARAMTEVDQISAAGARTMIVKKNGSLWAVGFNRFGQMGDGTAGNNRLIPVEVKEKNPGGGVASAITNVDKVSAGIEHNMILKNDDTLWAVGLNDFGQLGDGSNATRLTAVQVMISAGTPMTNVDQVSAGGAHTVILKKNGELWAVGRNNVGQLGDGSKTSRVFPVAVKNAEGRPMTEVAQVSAGTYHTMILKKNGDLWAVGLNEYGQLGDGSTTNKNIPVQVMEIPPGGTEPRAMTGVAQVSAGKEHTMIVKSDGTLWAVGNNGYGQLGNNGADNLASRLNPEQITPVDGCHDYLTEE